MNALDLSAIEARLQAAWHDMGLQALSSYTGARGSLPLTDVDALIAEVRAGRAEIERLSEAAELAQFEIDDLRGISHDLCAQFAAAEAELRASREVIAATDFRSIRNLVNGTSLPLDMQPARERWLRQLDALAALPVQEDPDRLVNLAVEKAEELARLIHAAHDLDAEERCVICDMGTDMNVHRNLNAKGYHPFIRHPHAPQFDGPVQEVPQ